MCIEQDCRSIYTQCWYCCEHESIKPVVVLSNVEITFVWPDDLRYFVGYRFVEHAPTLTARPLVHPKSSRVSPPLIPDTQHHIGGDWLDKWRTSYANPDNELNLRFTGGIGFGFGPSVAKVPFLSELLMQALGNANGTLTQVRKADSWQALPVPFTHYHTAAGVGVYQDTSGQVECGLIVLESASRTEAPASYWLSVAPEAAWERSVYVSNRHPADCLHAGVDMGPLEAGEARTVQGKFYWLEGTKDDVVDLWRDEFGV